MRPVDRDLERQLRGLRAPDEEAVEERSLEVVRAAYEDHTPPHPSRSMRRLAVATCCGVVALAIGLSPAGAKVGDLVSDVFDREPAGEPNAKPQLRSLPADGQLLVQSEQGLWVVHADGSKRLLGSYEDAEWSPHGLFIAAADGNDLVALEPDGTVRWTVTAPDAVTSPRWSPCCDRPFPDYRIAYLSGRDLRVVDADGSDDRLIARGVRPALAWSRQGHLLSYVTSGGQAKSVDVDTGNEGVGSDGALAADARAVQSPVGRDRSLVRSTPVRSRLELVRAEGGRRTLFDAPGRLIGPTWSPDGRWLLVGWPAADQWIFIPVERGEKPVAIGRISEQFAPGAASATGFPHVLGWGPAPPG
jgi:hypothetical protein